MIFQHLLFRLTHQSCSFFLSLYGTQQYCTCPLLSHSYTELRQETCSHITDEAGESPVPGQYGQCRKHWGHCGFLKNQNSCNKIPKLMAVKMAQRTYCSFRGPSLVSSIHTRQLTTISKDSSTGTLCLCPPWAPPLVWIYHPLPQYNFDTSSTRHV